MTSFVNSKSIASWLGARRKMLQGLVAMCGILATTDIGLPHQARLVVTAVIAVLGVLGIHQVANDPIDPPAPPAL